MAESALRNLQRERMNARRERAGMEPFVPQAPTKTAGQAMADMLGGMSIPLSFVPLAGDVAGLGADAAMYAAYPEERTLGNAAMTLAGIVPGIPGAAAMRAGGQAAEGALDMSQAARMQRAKEQAFTVNEHGQLLRGYHGSPVEIKDQFRSDLLGHNTNANSAFGGFFFSSNPETASAPPYATIAPQLMDDYLNIKYNFPKPVGFDAPISQQREYKKNLEEAMTKLQADPAIVRSKIQDWENAMPSRQGSDAEWRLYEFVKDYGAGQKNAIADIRALINDPNVADDVRVPLLEKMPELRRNIEFLNDLQLYESHQNEAERFYQQLGSEVNTKRFDNTELAANVTPVNLRMQNPLVFDMGGKHYREKSYADLIEEAKSKGHDSVVIKNTFDGGKEKTDIFVVFDPANIRSVNAAFDPAKRNSANLTAGIMGGAVGLSALRQLMPQQEQE